MSARFLDGADFLGAIKAIEQASSAEVVVALRRRSNGYHHANLVVGVLVAFAALAAMLFAEHTFTLAAILLDPFGAGLAGGALVQLLPDVKRLLTPRRTRRRHVERAARAAFVERNVHATRGRTGILVYISWLERQVVVVPDLGVTAALPPDAISALEHELTERMASGRRVAEQLAAFAPEVGQALPRRDDDVNELPDAIHSDMGRA